MLLVSSQNISAIARFAVLFQLWAGICVLCFYGELLDKLVAGDKRKRIENLLNDFKQNLHGLMSDKEHNDFSLLIDGSLNNYKNCIVHLGKFSFCYCLLILFFSAIDNYEFARFNIACVAVLYVLYARYVMFGKGVSWTFRMWTFLIPAFATGFLFVLPYDILPDSMIVSEETIAIVLLLILLVVPFFGIMRYYWENHVLSIIWAKADVIDESFQKYSLWKTLPNVDNFIKINDSYIKDILSSDLPVAEKQNLIDKYIYKSVVETFQILRFKRYIGVYCKHTKQYVVHNRPIVMFNIAIALIIVFYVFEVVMCALNSQSLMQD